MKDIAIYGAGGFGREVACIISKINELNPIWNLIGFFDDGKSVGNKNEYGVILGGMQTLNDWTAPLDIIIAIGTPHVAASVVSNIINSNIEFPNLISPDCSFFDKSNVFFGKGNIIALGCFISCNVHIGDFNIFNGGITVGHDARIGDFNAFMPAVRISGFDSIGTGNFFGVSSVILQGVEIGNVITLGANSVLMKSPKDGMTYLGNPARVIF